MLSAILLTGIKIKHINLAFRICGNREEAEEIAQDSFLKAYRSLSGFKMKSSFATWLYRIVYNTAISHVRIKKKGVLSLEDFPADATDFIGIIQVKKRQRRNTEMLWLTLHFRK